MSRLMSVAFTEQAVIERRKTVTRRKGWWKDKNGRMMLFPGDRLTLCRKVMGRKPGEPLVRICDVEVICITRERLETCGFAGELEREGFPDMSYEEFMERFFAPQGIGRHDDVTRIEWRYLDEPSLERQVPDA